MSNVLLDGLMAVALAAALLTVDAFSGERAYFKRDVGPAKGLARGCGLREIGRLRARRSEEIVGSRWGVILNRYNHEHRAERRLEQLAATGAKWAKLVPNWDLIEKKGVYEWNSPDHQLDDLVAGLLKRRITPIFLLFGGNRLYTPHTPPPVPPGVEVLDDPEVKKAWHAYRNKLPGTEVAKMMTDPEANKAWHAFLEAMARRYHQHVRVWEVWNEPNIRFFWKPHPNAKAYGRMVKEVAEIIKAVDPKATVLAGATANVRIAFFRGLLDSEGADSFDFCSVHPYNAVPETQDGMIRQLQDFLASRGKPRVLWQSECSLPSRPDTAGWGGGGPWDEVKQAKWLARSLFFLGLCEEQALVARVKDKGVVVITGCGHPTVEVILEMVRRLSDEPLYAIAGGLHFPVTESRFRRRGIQLQMFLGTGKPPWQRISDDDLTHTIDQINEAAPKRVLLSAHDTCDHALDRLAGELTAETMVLQAGQMYRV